MSLRQDAKSVLKELSPILAGFKLALIVTGWFGLGSVAQWVVTRWYPFTRWVWDQITQVLEIPVLPVVVKDSLTALVFFLPLGVGAILNRYSRRTDRLDRSHRFVAAFFGIVILMLICKDVFRSLIDAFEARAQTVETNFFAIFQRIVTKIEQTDPKILGALVVAYFIVSSAIYWRVRKNERLKEVIWKRLQIAYMTAGLVSGFISASTLTISLGLDGFSESSEDSAILFALALLFLIVALLSISVAYAPRKLYIASGAAIAFILAAMMFDFAAAAIRFIESIPS